MNHQDAQPAESEPMFVPTLNQMGFMINAPDAITQAWVDFAVKAPGPAMEIGAAFGRATLEALQSGAQVIANDIDPRHLTILEEKTPAPDRDRLTCKPGAFPDDLDIAADTLGAVLISRVLHFFDGPKIEQAAQTLYHWLAPGGKVFISAETPYLKNLQRFLPLYEERKINGDPWPGWVEDITYLEPRRIPYLPPQMHFLDVDVLSRVFGQAGFIIEQCETFSRPYYPEDIRFDGRESVGLIARKPA